MKKFAENILYTPGPASVPQRVLNAMAKPILHHRTPEFSHILKELLEKWQWLFATEQAILPIHTTGRGAMEASLTNTLKAGDSIICICNGKFGEFYPTIAERYGITVHKICTNWEQVVSLEEVKQAMVDYPQAKAITVCHNESTTALTTNVQAIAQLAKSHGMLTIVDAISSGGCARIDFDAWGIDVLVVASQKGFMSPTGMSLAILSQAAWQACETSTLPKYYTNFNSIRKNVCAERPETPGSTPVSLIYALHEAMCILEEEGREDVFLRHEKNAKAVRAGLTSLGFDIFPLLIPEEFRSVSLTAFTTPHGFSADQCKNALKNDYGLQIANGLGHLKGKVLRVGHMGNIYERDIITFFSCLEMVLMQQNILSTPGISLQHIYPILK